MERTEEEYAAMDDLFTRTTPRIEQGKGGPLTRQRELLRALDDVAANYITTLAQATSQTPSQIIGAWAREKIAGHEGIPHQSPDK
jgi:glutamate/tyrosine decarboxylase-like PLP-dependent enzyme